MHAVLRIVGNFVFSVDDDPLVPARHCSAHDRGTLEQEQKAHSGGAQHAETRREAGRGQADESAEAEECQVQNCRAHDGGRQPTRRTTGCTSAGSRPVLLPPPTALPCIALFTTGRTATASARGEGGGQCRYSRRSCRSSARSIGRPCGMHVRVEQQKKSEAFGRRWTRFVLAIFPGCFW